MQNPPRNHLQRVHNILEEAHAGSRNSEEVLVTLGMLGDWVKTNIVTTRFATGWSHDVTEPIIKAVLTEAIDSFIAELREAATPVDTAESLAAKLRESGIDIQRLTRNSNGTYVAEFFNYELEGSVPSARTWLRRMESVIEGMTDIITHDTIASWRDGSPVVFATVLFRLDV